MILVQDGLEELTEGPPCTGVGEDRVVPIDLPSPRAKASGHAQTVADRLTTEATALRRYFQFNRAPEDVFDLGWHQWRCMPAIVHDSQSG